MLHRKIVVFSLLLLYTSFSLAGSPLLMSQAKQQSSSSGPHLRATNNLGAFEAINITNSEYNTTLFGRQPVIAIGDGKISDIWSKIPSYPNPSYGSNGMVQAAYGKNTIYFLFTFDTDITWIAVQWDSDGSGTSTIPMQKNDDMWVMGKTVKTTIDGDGYSAGQGTDPFVYPDSQNDVVYETVVSQHFVQIELARKLFTGDNAGHDIEFIPGSSVIVMYASNLHHGVENEITQQTFSLSKSSLGAASQPAPVTSTPIDVAVFVGMYLNSALAYGIVVELVLFLPVILILRYRVNHQ